ncbi:MAG: 3-dehydroquinate synthase, partial [Verrucomicrobiota bacterium]|nr:3-dehydroquinate synthase [Verrucomicrobiota bacterium]
VCAMRLSKDLGFCEGDEEEDLLNLLKAYGLPDRLREALPLDGLLSIMMNDKKVLGGKLRFVLMKEIGRSMTVGDVENERVCEVWRSVGAK